MKQGWEVRQLGDLVEILDSKRKPITKRDRNPGEFPYYGATGIVDYVDGYIFDEQLILLGEDGAKWNSGDQSAFIITGKTWVNNHAHVLKPYRDILNDQWLVYNLNHQNLLSFVTGLTVPKLNQGQTKKILIPLPPLEEQKQIVAKLDQCFEAIDKAKANAAKNLENAKELFQSKLNDIFSQKGEGWVEKILIEWCDNHKDDIVDGPFGSNLKRSDYIADGYPVLKIQNVKPFDIHLKKMDYVSEEKYIQLKRHSFVQGDIIMTKLGAPLGVSAIINDIKTGLIVADLVRIRANQIDTEFLCYHLNSNITNKFINSQQKGTTRPRVRITIVRGLPIAAPSINFQKDIVSKLNSLQEQTQSLESKYQQELNSLEELKKSILQKAFEGEL